MTMTHRTLSAALLLSAGVHLLVLLFYMNSPQSLIIDSPESPAGSFIVVMPPAVSRQIQKMSTEAIPDRATNPKPITAEPAKTQDHAKLSADDMPTTETASAANNQLTDAMLQNDVLKYLHAQFQVRFQYPLLARKRGWSGEVVIALNVNHHGLIDQIAVQKSSGYPILDDNAVQTFRAIGAVAPAIQSRINNDQQLSIPVIYRLTGG